MRYVDIDPDIEDRRKEMLLVDNVENRVFLRKLFETMYDELPVPKKKK